MLTLIRYIGIDFSFGFRIVFFITMTSSYLQVLFPAFYYKFGRAEEHRYTKDVR